jgi:hypothetical protein
VTQYPPGAGPTAGYFQGAVFVPSAVQDQGASVTGPPATVGGPGPTAYTRRVDVGTYYSPPPGGGIAQCVYGFLPNPGSRTLLIRRITLFCPQVATRCYVVLTALTDKQFAKAGLDLNQVTPLSVTDRGDFDENEADPPYAIPPGQNLGFIWDRLNNGAGAVIITDPGQNVVHVEYDEA